MLAAELLADLPDKMLDAIEADIRRVRAGSMLHTYRPYPRQQEFHASGGPMHVRERLLMAASQVGKTWSAAMEHAMHLTGRYPDWWCGTRFDAPVIGWAASETGQSTRDTVQRLLLGEPGQWGTGAIPRADILEIKRSSHGVADAVETILVRHQAGGTSRITIKTYDQGRLRWQGETLDFVWFDEEPPEDIYFEGLTRTNAKGGYVALTFTPLQGASAVVRRFTQDKPAGAVITTMTLDDASHYTPEQRAAIVATYPAHQRDARTKGIPTLGSGAVFPVDPDTLREPPLQIPNWWPRIVGLDFGWDHPTAAAWITWDRDTDTVHVYDAYRVSQQTPLIHSATIKSRGPWIPVAWPHDGLQHDKGSGIQLAEQYRGYGVAMLKDKASHAPVRGEKEGTGGNGLEAGITMMLDRMLTGRLKIAKHLHDVFDEIAGYHRDAGQIVAERDDILSAIRYGLMMLRHAKTRPVTEAGPDVAAFRGSYSATGPMG